MSKQRRRGKGPTRGRDRHDNKEPKKKSSQGRERKCYYCDEIGHIRPDCPKRKRYDKADRANVAQRDLSDTDGETVLATVEQRKATTNKEHTWYLDSGATCHVTCNQDWLHDYVDLTGESRNLILGDNFKCRIHGYGTLRTTTYVDGDKRKITFQKVLYAPELAKNLLSTARIASKGCKLTIDAQGCSVSDQRGRTILRARARGNMLVVPINPEEPTHQVNTVKQLPTLDELHRHFGHAGEKRLRTTLKALGLDVSTATLSACQLIGKQMLARASCGHVVVAPNGEQGVQAWEQQGPFHIVLMDYHMPVMDGLEATSRIRQREQELGMSTRTPIIVTSASLAPKDRALGASAGMDDWLQKPFDRRILTATILRWARHKQQQLEASAEKLSHN